MCKIWRFCQKINDFFTNPLDYLERVRDSYVWPGMRREINEFIKMCSTCRVHARKLLRTGYEEMPLPASPMQVVGMDLTGPFVRSTRGNRYLLNIIDHCTGWLESYPIPRKTATWVHRKLNSEFVPRHGFPEVVITDRGGEFNDHELERWFVETGIKHRRSTAYHPQTNGKVERCNRTLKEMLARMVNNQAKEWETQLSSAVMAYNNSVSSVTGHTPFMLLYGRRNRLPLTRSFQAASGSNFNTRLYEHARALTIARDMTQQSRYYNRRRLQERANTGQIEIGDSVVVKAPERLTLTSRWDPEYVVQARRGNVYWLRDQRTGKQRVVNRDKLIVVDPEMRWDEVNPRPTRWNPDKLPKIRQSSDNLP